jgi:hypothetical protein
MAGDAEKKRAKRNSEILLVLRAGTAVALLLYVALRFFVFAAASRWVQFGFGLAAVLQVAMVLVLGSWSSTVDLTDKGLVEYMRDSVYFGWIVVAVALVTDWAYLLLLVIPAFAIYKVFGALPAASMPSAGGDEDEKRRAPKKVSKLSKADRMAQLGAEYRGGKPKFNIH